MQVVGHGIPDAAIAGLGDAIDWFFALPMEDKQAWRAPRPVDQPRIHAAALGAPELQPRAWSRPTTCSRRSTSAPPPPTFPTLDLDREIYAENIWPDADGGPTFRAGVEAWTRAAGGVARRMTEIFAAALGLPVDHFTRFTDHSIDVLRMNHYDVPPGVRVGPSQMGMGAHTDYGIVTVLWADPVPGLEILRPDGSWAPVLPAPGALVDQPR